MSYFRRFETFIEKPEISNAPPDPFSIPSVTKWPKRENMLLCPKIPFYRDLLAVPVYG